MPISGLIDKENVYVHKGVISSYSSWNVTKVDVYWLSRGTML
jgi:hypothetical protein